MWNFLKPKWRHAKKEVRIKAINKLENQEKLYEVVSIDKDDEVRQIALSKITSSDYLEKILEHELLQSKNKQDYFDLCS